MSDFNDIIPPTDNENYSDEFIEFYIALIEKYEREMKENFNEDIAQGFEYEQINKLLIQAQNDADLIVAYACFLETAGSVHLIRRTHQAMSKLHDGAPVTHLITPQHLEACSAINRIVMRSHKIHPSQREEFRLNVDALVFNDLSQLNRIISFLNRPHITTVDQLKEELARTSGISTSLLEGAL